MIKLLHIVFSKPNNLLALLALYSSLNLLLLNYTNVNMINSMYVCMYVLCMGYSIWGRTTS
ncbi:MAG: hypothetical protein PHD45_07080 [Bacteroidales bacterium]|nr:hypothetical protein [Bacteroidales bacterium]